MGSPLERLDNMVAVLKGERRDRRKDARVRTLRRCRAFFGEQTKEMRCFLIDVSKSGARLRPVDAAALPEYFDLEIEHGLNVSCKVVRRSDIEVCVTFQFGK